MKILSSKKERNEKEEYVHLYSISLRKKTQKLDMIENMEMRGIEPRASRMQSGRSTIWATSPFILVPLC